MDLMRMPYDLSICKIESASDIDLSKDFFFTARTDEEISLVCKTADVPKRVIKREDDWKCLKVQGPLDFSIVGIISEISGILADNGIAVFVVSTFDTDYVLVKKDKFEQAVTVLDESGYSII